MKLLVTSGLQTGVDRAAADVAMNFDIWWPGYVPKGRLAEDGRIPDRYDCIELRSVDYSVRTLRNVENSDATVLITCGPVRAGTGSSLTQRTALAARKPFKHIDLIAHESSEDRLKAWLLQLQGVFSSSGKPIVNISGPRESSSPGIFAQTAMFLTEVFHGLRD